MVPGLRGEELWVKAVVEAHLGVPVDQHDDGSRPSMHDLDVRLDGGRTAALEVTAAADGESIELWNLLNGSSGRWIIPGLRGGWMVSVSPLTRAKRIRAELPTLLGQLEERGVGQYSTSWRTPVDPLEVALTDLGVLDAGQGATDYPGSVYMTIERSPERTGGGVPGTGEPLSQWVGHFLHASEQRDVLAKLRRAVGAAERHAFVIVPGFSTAPFPVTDLLWRSDGPVPVSPPELPEPVTHAWVMSTWSIGRGLRWDPEVGWQQFDSSPGTDTATA